METLTAAQSAFIKTAVSYYMTRTAQFRTAKLAASTLSDLFNHLYDSLQVKRQCADWITYNVNDHDFMIRLMSNIGNNISLNDINCILCGAYNKLQGRSYLVYLYMVADRSKISKYNRQQYLLSNSYSQSRSLAYFAKAGININVNHRGRIITDRLDNGMTWDWSYITHLISDLWDSCPNKSQFYAGIKKLASQFPNNINIKKNA